MMDGLLLTEFVDINPSVALAKGGKYSCVMMEDIVPGRRYVSTGEEKVFKGGGSRFQKGDVLFARITPCLENGKIAQYIGESELSFGSTEFFIFRQKEGISYAGYVFYLASSDIIRKPAEKSMFGASGRQRADLNVVREIEVPAPPLPTQRKIAAVLSAYDDLIENNTRRIHILEEMAQIIYREWFVHFRFPGHEGVRMVDIVPKGWEMCRFSELVLIDPTVKLDKYQEKPFVDMAGLSTTSMVIDCYTTRKGNSGSKFQNGDTVFPRITPSVEHGKGGFVQFLQPGAIALGSTEFIVFRSIDLSPEFVYFLSRQPDFRENAIQSMVGASGRQRVQKQCFNNYFLARPPQSLLRMFSDTVSPIFKIIQILSEKNVLLLRTRDLLLPRLVSGEIDVSEISDA